MYFDMYFDDEEDDYYSGEDDYYRDDDYYREDYYYSREDDYYRSRMEDEFEPHWTTPGDGHILSDSLDLTACLWRGSRTVSQVSRKHITSLQELCSRVVGQTFPFELVLQHQPRLPEKLQTRIAFWSFPLDKKQVLEYGKMMGARIEAVHAEECVVSEMIQTGMHLTGKVASNSTRYGYVRKSNFQVYVQMDRGCITAARCCCETKRWCTHILALVLARLEDGNASNLEICPALSETLSKFSRDELQKLLQYFVEQLPLEGVPAVQEIACALQGTDLKESSCATVPDATAGCNTGEGPMWYIDQGVLLQSLEVVYRKLFPSQHAQLTRLSLPSLHGEVSQTTTIVDFQQFTEGEKPSIFAVLLQRHNSHITCVLKWALDKMIELFNRSPDHFSIAHNGELKWTAWCFCRMVAPALRIFFADPVLSSSGKEDVRTSLATACAEAAPFSKPVAALLQSFLHVTEAPPVPTPQQFRSTFTQLQHCKEGSSSEPADHLNNLMSAIQYFKFHQKLTSPDAAEMVVCACKALFPASLLSTPSIQDLVTPAMKSLPLELIVEYGILLMSCLVKTRAEQDIIMEMALKLFRIQSSLKRSEGLMKYHTWAGERILQLVKENGVAVSLERSEGGSLPLDRFKDLLTVKDSSAAAVEAWSWHVMELICHAVEGQQEALETVRRNVQDFIGQLGCTPIPDDGDEEALHKAILSVLVSLFTSLPPSSAQDLFKVLHRAYPQPIDCIESGKLCKLRPYARKYQCYETGRPTLQSTCALPQLGHADVELQQTDSASGTLLAVLERASHVLSTVSQSHVTFLEKLYNGIRTTEGAEPLLIMQLRLLHLQAHNCRQSRWYINASNSQYSDLTEVIASALLHKGNHSAAVKHLVDTWRYCLTHRQMFKALVKAAATGMPVCNDVCELVQSAVDSLPTVATLALEVLFYGLPEKFIDQMVSAIQLVQRHLLKKHLENANMPAIRCLCQLLELVGRMHAKIKTNLAQITDAHQYLQRLQDFAKEIITVMASQAGIYRQMTASECSFEGPRLRCTLNVDEIAGVIRDSGQDVLLELGSFLSLLPSFPTDIRMLYAHLHGVNISSVSNDLLLASPFQSAILQALEDEKINVRREVDIGNTSGSVSFGMVLTRRALKRFRNLSKEFGLEADCNAFESEVASQLAPPLRQEFERDFEVLQTDY